jgi:chaperonin GroES
MAYATKAPRDGGKSDKKSPRLTSTLIKLEKYANSLNIAELLDKEEVSKIGYEVEREYQIDKLSRSDWEESANKAMDVALQVRKAKNFPFENAANVKYPLVTVAALQFGARAYPAIVDGTRIVKCQVLGEDKDGQKRDRSDRVSQHMSWQLMHQMEEWEEDTDVLLHHLPIVGCAFRKVWRAEELKRNKAEMVPAIHLVVNQKTRKIDTAPRITHEIPLYPHEIEDRKRAGVFLEDVDLPSPTEGGDGNDEDAPHWFLEQHRLMDLDEDGYREPYIVTVHKDSCEVVRIVANYTMEDIYYDEKRITRIQRGQYFVKYSFIPDPKGGFYDIGFGKLLESLSETIDTTINQMLDAGTLQNAGGGFIGSGLRLKKGVISLSPGKYVSVEASGTTLKDAIWNFQHPGPSAVLFNLLGMMVDAARDITAVKDILTGDSGDKGVQTATTTLALIEQGLKVFTVIYKRIYRAMADEFKLLYQLNARYMEDKEYFTFLDTQKAVAKADYESGSMDIMPVADPRMVTEMQKTGRAQVLMQIQEHPVYGTLQDPMESLRRIYDAVGMTETESLIVEQKPDPMQEIVVAGAVADVKGKEAKAAKDAASADKTTAETEMMTAERDAAAFGEQLGQQLNALGQEPPMQPEQMMQEPMMPGAIPA